MKKKISVAVILLFMLVCICSTLFPCSLQTVHAESAQQAEEKLNESILGLIDELDLQALQDYIDSLDGVGKVRVKDRLLSFIKGDTFEYEGFVRRLVSVLFGNIREILPAFACIAAIALLSGLLSALKSGTLANTSADMIFLISYVSALIPLLGILTECVEKATGSVNAMQRQMQILFPLLLTLMATSGGTISVTVCRPAVAFFSTTIVSTVSSVIFPITLTIMVFSIASNLTKDLKMNKFGAFFKGINKWLIGISVSVFGLFFTLQGITASTYDGVVRRTVKYAIGNGIPIVGGFLSGGFDLAVAGSILIKNSLGSMSIFLMISVLFEPIVLLVAVNVMLRFTSAVTQPFGDSRISDFLGETADNLNYCTAGVLFTAFLYFLCIVMMVTVSEALF